MTNRMKKKIGMWLGATLFIGVIYAYWVYSQQYIRTDDAYVNADVVQIAAQVTGPISHLYVVNNEFVENAQPLFDIDPTSFQLAVEAANGMVILKQKQLENIKITADYKTAETSLKSAKAALEQAKLDLEHAHVTAPMAGFITNMNVYEGAAITANQPLFSLISHAYYWVDANFKETDLVLIRPGQRVVIQVDIYPENNLEGIVDSIRKGNIPVFSLPSSQHAKESSVKMIQRVPVRVRILNPPKDKPLRIGTSATVTIYVNSNIKFFKNSL